MENNNENIILFKCDFCDVISETQNFDDINNITKEEMTENNIDPQLYDLHFNYKICSVCRNKKSQTPYSEL